MLSIESEVAKDIDFENILNNFANKKARKVFFWKSNRHASGMWKRYICKQLPLPHLSLPALPLPKKFTEFLLVKYDQWRW